MITFVGWKYFVVSRHKPGWRPDDCTSRTLRMCSWFPTCARKSLAQFDASTPVPPGQAPSTPVRTDPPTLFQTPSRPPRVGRTETASPGLASTPGASLRVVRSLRFRPRVRPLSARVAQRVPPPHAPSRSRPWHLPSPPHPVRPARQSARGSKDVAHLAGPQGARRQAGPIPGPRPPLL